MASSMAKVATLVGEFVHKRQVGKIEERRRHARNEDLRAWPRINMDGKRTRGGGSAGRNARNCAIAIDKSGRYARAILNGDLQLEMQRGSTGTLQVSRHP